jgi:hypothetical protein
LEWHINDLSLCGQFPDPQSFRHALEPILQVRSRRAELRGRLFCSRQLSQRPVTRDRNLQEAIFAVADATYKRLALSWFANSGPFWDDVRAVNPNDFFRLGEQDVTDEGLGEAARRRLNGIDARTYSFAKSPFEYSPVVVSHGLLEEPFGDIDVANAWHPDALAEIAAEKLTSWRQMLEAASGRMDRLILSEEIGPRLAAHPFQSSIADRALHLLQVLQRLAEETTDDGGRTPAGEDLYRQNFMGDAPLFTDESDTNKSVFASELTFRDPSQPGKTLFCPWHGKISSQYFRIHFEWKRPAGQRHIKVVYIGPKITKR